MKNAIKKLTDKIKAALAERFIASEPLSAIFYELYASDNTLENEIADLRKELAELKSEIEAEIRDQKFDIADLRDGIDNIEYDINHIEIPDEDEIEENITEKLREALVAALNEI